MGIDIADIGAKVEATISDSETKIKKQILIRKQEEEEFDKVRGELKETLNIAAQNIGCFCDRLSKNNTVMKLLRKQELPIFDFMYATYPFYGNIVVLAKGNEIFVDSYHTEGEWDAHPRKFQYDHIRYFEHQVPLQ